MHDAMLWPAHQRETTHRDGLADEHGFIVVYPSGMTPWGAGTGVWASPKPFPSVLRWTAEWARRNRCGPNPSDSSVAADLTSLEYMHCANDATVVLYPIRGGGRSWAGGEPLPKWFVGPTNRSIDATTQMWAFF